jgi:hypothetical protein
MKKFSANLSRIVYVVSALFLLSIPMLLRAENRYTSNDPYPVYTAANPLGMYTFWEDCEPETSARLSISVFRQRADMGHGGPCTQRFGLTAPCPTESCTNCCQVCPKEVELGDIHGRWNMVALLYPEANGNTTVQQNLIAGLGLESLLITGVSDATVLANCLTKLETPSLADPSQQFGFFSVPIEYRKYGIRLQAELDLCGGFGIRLQTGLASIKQEACFVDKTCGAQGNKCTVTQAGTPQTTECATTCCLINEFGCDCKKLVINGIMDQLEIAVRKETEVVSPGTGQVEMLNLNIENFCKTDMEDITFSLYWTRCFDINQNSQNDCWPEFTIAPYFVGEVSAPLSDRQCPQQLFSLPFGLNKHWGYGFTGGFTLNFIETVELGFEAGFTRFSEEKYCAQPVPTHELQQGIYPRKADLNNRPGTVWSFGATLGAYHFLSCLSSYVQFRLLHKCDDHICIITPIPIAPVGGTIEDDTFVKENIKVKKMEEEAAWTSSFVNVHFDYDISENIALGFFWQAPVSQEFAYRPTTVMGSIIVQY